MSWSSCEDVPEALHYGDLVVCVHVLLASEESAAFLRLGIKRCSITKFEVEEEEDIDENGISEYVFHNHNNCGYNYPMFLSSEACLDYDKWFFNFKLSNPVNGPFVSGVIPYYVESSSAALGPILYHLVRVTHPDDDVQSYNLYSCQFTSPTPRWRIISTFYPNKLHRHLSMITVGNKLFAYEECGVLKHTEQHGSSFPPLGYLFDFTKTSWNIVPLFQYPEKAKDFKFMNLYVASMGQNILVIDRCYQKQFSFDTQTFEWTPFEVPGLDSHIYNIRGQPITVSEVSTIFWFDREGEIRAYNWEDSKLYKGRPSGFGNECDFKRLNPSSLLPLSNNLICLVWTDLSQMMHLSLLRVRFQQTRNQSTCGTYALTAKVVACFGYHIGSSIPCFYDTHLLGLTSVNTRRGTGIRIRSCKVVGTVNRQESQDDKTTLFVLSDLHTDYAENMTWVKCISTSSHQDDILLVAGDVAETYDKFLLTMSSLRKRFKHVFYVPGNHDLWCRTEADDTIDSLQKLDMLLSACDEIGVDSKPKIIGDLGIIPLFSWYHGSFDVEQDITGHRIPPLEMVCKDFHVCKWPAELSERDDSLALFFDAMNEKHAHTAEEIQQKCTKIITFSHFIPRLELCPEKRMLFYPNLPKIIGSNYLETRIRSIHGAKGRETACHVFGHTHFGWDAVLDGIRYVQAPLAYPRERKRRMNGGEDRLPLSHYAYIVMGNFPTGSLFIGRITIPSISESQTF